jgi:glutathione peroxidase
MSNELIVRRATTREVGAIRALVDQYAGKVLLIANIASHCGFTPQMKPLAELERLYGPKGFKVLGFLSDDFGRPAGTDEEVSACNLEHGASFDEFAIVGVKKGASQAPLFAWLTSRPGLEGDVRWNFSKWLIEEQLVSTVPWDEAGACVRFSVTFAAKDATDEKRVLQELEGRLKPYRFRF